MHPPVAGGDDPPTGLEGQGFCFPVRYHSTSAFDHRNQREVIEGIEPDVDADIDPPRGDLRIGHAAAAIDGPACFRLQALEGREIRCPVKIGIAGRQQRRRDIRAGADTNGLAIARRRRSVAADPALTGCRHVDDTERRLPVEKQGNQRAVNRETREKGQGTVDRVDDPDELAVWRRGAAFLANDPVAGPFGRDHLAEPVLDRPVDRRHRAAVSFRDDVEGFRVALQDAGARRVRQPVGESREFDKFGGHDANARGYQWVRI